MELAGLNIKFVPGVGEKRASLLEQEMGIQSYEDMLYYIPYKYIDRTRVYTIRELTSDLPYIQVKAKITNLTSVGAGKQMRMVATAYDGTGELELVWFTGHKYLSSQITPDKEYLIFGKPTIFNHKMNIVHPEMDLYETSAKQLVGFQAIYPTTEKMKKKLPDLPADQQDTSKYFQSYQRQDSRNPPGMVHQKTQLDLPARGFVQHPLPGKPGYAPQGTIPA